MKRAIIGCGLVLATVLYTGCQLKKQERKTTTQEVTRQAEPEEKAENDKPVDLSKPVAVYQANKEDAATNNDFTVEVYPTKDPKKFRVAMLFGENKAEDYVAFPDPQYYKEVALRKSQKANSCLLGFVGKDGKFNEMKEISGSTTQIKITSLKAYYFTTKENR